MSQHHDSDWTPTDERRLAELVGALREDVRAPADFQASVMRAVDAIPASLWHRLVGWWLTPRPLRVSPAMGVLAVAASAALFMLWPSRNADVAQDLSAGQVVTRFVLVAPEASSVHLTGDFLSWNPAGIELENLRGTGVWTADVPLPPGVYQYTFVIDEGRWVSDPRAMSQVDDGFGETNSVVIVPGGEA
jgi:hypothetical protein